jgi:PAT family beta-lactamase induction signal transducer AmpG
MADSAPAERPKGIRAYLDRRAAVMLALGFAAGLPNLLIFDTLSAWLREAGLSLETIAFFSLATLAYAFKFVWAPLVDRTQIPILTPWLGHRRSWMLATQIAIIIGLWLVALSNPAEHLGVLALYAVFTGFVSATQDIVIDAWRIEAAPQDQQGAMAAAYQWGYRIALIVAGAVPLILAQNFGWSLSYGVMACLMVIGMAAVLAAPREQEHAIRPLPGGDLPRRPLAEKIEWLCRLVVLAIGVIILGSGLSGKATLLTVLVPQASGEAFLDAWATPTAGVVLKLVAFVLGLLAIIAAASPLPGRTTRPGLYLSHAFGDPLADFFSRYGRDAGLILALICLYRISDFVLNLMNPFYLDLGFTLTEIAEIRKLWGVAMSMFGVFAGGYAIARFGLLRPLMVGALASPITHLSYAWLTTQGPELHALAIAIGIDNIATGFAGTCLIAYMSSLTKAGFTATQYALFSSLYALPGKLIASQSGRIVERAAHAAEDGGVLAPLKQLVANLPPESLASGAAKAAVTPAALGAGYIAFFVYSFAIGLVGLALTIVVVTRQQTTKA